MRIRRLWISNFRGVRDLDWKIPTNQQLIALVGPGDSGKSTILDAIHYLLGDRWNIPFSDTDFFGVDVECPIVITALLTDLPSTLKNEAVLGMWLSGVDVEGEAHQDPEDGLDPALMVQLVVNADLEPRWYAIRTAGERQILSASQRRAFSTFKVDDRTDAQLRWSRNSPLGRMAASSGGEREALAAASRAARDTLNGHQNTTLGDIAARVQERANRIGSGSFANIKPGLDTSRSSMGAGLALYEDVIPLTSYGLGSRRLASLAVQQLATGSRSIAVVDELESGLEPHRAVRLLNYLLSDEHYSQVIVTTHSPVIVEQAALENLATVQNRSGVATVTSLGNASELVQRLRRARPSSLLARRVVVTEGKTEHGLLLELIGIWDTQRAACGQSTAAGEGVAIQDANGGTEVGPRSEALVHLGFTVMAFLDNDDRGVDVGIFDAQLAGVQVARWDFGLNTEMQVCSHLQADALTDFLSLGSQRRNSDDTVRQDLNAIDPTNSVQSLDVQDWLDAGMTIQDARNRIAQAAIKRKWFKDVDGGRDLGAWIGRNYEKTQLASTTRVLNQVRSFLYPEESASNGTSVGD